MSKLDGAPIWFELTTTDTDRAQNLGFEAQRSRYGNLPISALMGRP